MAKTASPVKGIEEEKRKDSAHIEDSSKVQKEDQMKMEENNDNIRSPPNGTAEDDSDSMQRDAMLTFLHFAKDKANTMLKVDSWIYNEMMGLKKKVEILQHNLDTINVKLSQLEGKMGDIPKKLNNYEQNLRMLIKESGTKMEQVTSSICAATTSLGKRANEDITSAEAPSKRTR